MSKNILIVSHERSGTHFLINSISWNFKDYSNSGVNQRVNCISVPATYDKEKLHDFFKNIKDNQGKIYKDHHQYEFYEPFWDEIAFRFHIFYIMREGKDVMTSCHYYFNSLLFHRSVPRGRFPFTKTVGELLRKNPTRYPFDDIYSEDRSNTMSERWAKHINSWIDVDDRINLIQYKSLYTNFETWVDSLAVSLETDFSDSIKRPTPKTGFAVAPRKGIIGDWMNHFTKFDEQFFYEEVNKVDKNLYIRFFEKDRLLIQYKGE